MSKVIDMTSFFDIIYIIFLLNHILSNNFYQGYIFLYILLYHLL